MVTRRDRIVGDETEDLAGAIDQNQIDIAAERVRKLERAVHDIRADGAAFGLARIVGQFGSRIVDGIIAVTADRAGSLAFEERRVAGVVHVADTARQGLHARDVRVVKHDADAVAAGNLDDRIGGESRRSEGSGSSEGSSNHGTVVVEELGLHGTSPAWLWIKVPSNLMLSWKPRVELQDGTLQDTPLAP